MQCNHRCFKTMQHLQLQTKTWLETAEIKCKIGAAICGWYCNMILQKFPNNQSVAQNNVHVGCKKFEGIEPCRAAYFAPSPLFVYSKHSKSSKSLGGSFESASAPELFLSKV